MRKAITAVCLLLVVFFVASLAFAGERGSNRQRENGNRSSREHFSRTRERTRSLDRRHSRRDNRRQASRTSVRISLRQDGDWRAYYNRSCNDRDYDFQYSTYRGSYYRQPRYVKIVVPPAYSRPPYASGCLRVILPDGGMMKITDTICLHDTIIISRCGREVVRYTAYKIFGQDVHVAIIGECYGRPLAGDRYDICH